MMHKGTILYVGGFELPDKNAAAHRVLNNAKIFRELGYNVVFCGVNKEVTYGKHPQTFDVSGFESSPLPYPTSIKQWIIQMFDVNHYTDMINKHNDIKLVICYNPHAIPLLKLINYCKKRKLKIITDCTEWYKVKWSISPKKMIRKLDMFFSMSCLQAKCDGMIAISSYLEKNFREKIKNIVVIPPLVDIKAPKYRLNDTEKRSDTTTLIYSGSPSASKESLGDVVECLQQIKDIKYIFKIVGINQNQFEKMYHMSINNDMIKFLGSVSHLEALQHVKDSDYAIIIRPKLRGTMAGFPTKFAEAISCGTAVIANATSDLPQYLADGKNGYLVDEDQLEEQLREILTSKEKPFVQREAFDYRAWIDKFQTFLEQLEL